MKNISILLLVMLCVPLFSQNPDEATRQARVNFATADIELNSTYQQMLEIYKSDTVFARNLRSAQRSWLRFRDTQVQMKYPGYIPNSKQLLEKPVALYLAQLTQERLMELKKINNARSIDKADFTGIWRGGNNSTARLKVTKTDGDVYRLELIHPTVRWEGVGYRMNNILIVVFRYSTEESQGFLTLTMENADKMTYRCINTDGSYRISGFYER